MDKTALTQKVAFEALAAVDPRLLFMLNLGRGWFKNWRTRSSSYVSIPELITCQYVPPWHAKPTPQAVIVDFFYFVVHHRNRPADRRDHFRLPDRYSPGGVLDYATTIKLCGFAESRSRRCFAIAP